MNWVVLKIDDKWYSVFLNLDKIIGMTKRFESNSYQYYVILPIGPTQTTEKCYNELMDILVKREIIK